MGLEQDTTFIRTYPALHGIFYLPAEFYAYALTPKLIRQGRPAKKLLAVMVIKIPEMSYKAYRVRAKEIATQTNQRRLYELHILGQRRQHPADPAIPRDQAVGTDDEDEEVDDPAEDSAGAGDDDIPPHPPPPYGPQQGQSVPSDIEVEPAHRAGSLD